MATLTIRKLPDGLRRRLEEEAQRRRLPLEETVVTLLEEKVGGLPAAEAERINTDFDEFIGTWSREEAEEFCRRVLEMRTIDEELWRD